MERFIFNMPKSMKQNAHKFVSIFLQRIGQIKEKTVWEHRNKNLHCSRMQWLEIKMMLSSEMVSYIRRIKWKQNVKQKKTVYTTKRNHRIKTMISTSSRNMCMCVCVPFYVKISSKNESKYTNQLDICSNLLFMILMMNFMVACFLCCFLRGKIFFGRNRSRLQPTHCRDK